MEKWPNSAVTDSSFLILNNDIINPKSDGIRFSSIHSKRNLIASNLIINPGNFDYYENGNTSFKGEDAYIMIPDASADLIILDNYLSRTGVNAGYSPIDYTLLPGSPLIDSAYPGYNGIAFDFYGHPRPYSLTSDIGAFEFNSSNLGVLLFAAKPADQPMPFPNPVKTTLTLGFSTLDKTDVSLDIYNIKGIRVYDTVRKVLNSGSQFFKVDVGNFDQGIFIYTIHTANYSTTGRFIKVN